MKDLVEYIVKNIVNSPDKVIVEETSERGGVLLKVSVDPEDMGIVIGKAGQTIKAIRKLLMIRAMAENQMVSLELVEPGGVQKDSERLSKPEDQDVRESETSDDTAPADT